MVANDEFPCGYYSGEASTPRSKAYHRFFSFVLLCAVTHFAFVGEAKE
jgi:hypothetical protein